MAFIYTRGDLIEAINQELQNKKGMLLSTELLANQTVRKTMTKHPLRSTMRRQNIVPQLFSDTYQYPAPSDFTAKRIVDIPPQAKTPNREWELITAEQFNVFRGGQYGQFDAYDPYNSRRPTYGPGPVGKMAIDDVNGVKTFLIGVDFTSSNIVVSPLDSLTSGGGTWGAYGDATNLTKDGSDYVKGNASIVFDIDASGGTTAGIENTALNVFDLEDIFRDNGSLFIYQKIASVTDLTNYTIRIGNDASNYYEVSTTTAQDGTAFQAGWNLLRFDLADATTVLAPTNTNMTYAAIFMTKDAGKISETGYKMDYFVAKKGKYFNVTYYSKFGWRDATTLAYKENSTSDGDFLVADTDEFDLLVSMGRVIGGGQVDSTEAEMARFKADHKELFDDYAFKNPDESELFMYEYYQF